jgi:hypothetical protein
MARHERCDKQRDREQSADDMHLTRRIFLMFAEIERPELCETVKA